MAFIENIKLRMHRRSLNKALRRQSGVQRASVSYEQAQEIGILFDASDAEQEELALRYASRLRSKNKKRVELLGFFSDSEKREFDLYPFYTKKDIDWRYLPRKSEVLDFMSRPFDICINFIERPPVHVDYIMTLSNARMRVGRNTDNTKAYDLIINDSQRDSAHFIGSVDTYLKIFNQKKPNERKAT